MALQPNRQPLRKWKLCSPSLKKPTQPLLQPQLRWLDVHVRHFLCDRYQVRADDHEAGAWFLYHQFSPHLLRCTSGYLAALHAFLRVLLVMMLPQNYLEHMI